MSFNTIAESLVEWAKGVCDELNDGYEVRPKKIEKALPLVSGRPTGDREGPLSADQFPTLRRLEQSEYRSITAQLEIWVAPDVDETWLRARADELSDALRNDRTLGGRVKRVGRSTSWDLERTYARFGDGTEVRLATLTMAIAEEV